ncbi:integrase family protein [Variovorax rhizosphaerae]|uniref:Integrase family protein n=1 Tax=Variovorax rhizosphaerae TaxID=1836200 RepID=A0ABU8WQ36_9BURK
MRRYIDKAHSGDVAGLHLVVSPGGSMSWSVRVTNPATGERPRLRVGDAKTMLIETAIEQARKLHEAAGDGDDPKAQRQANKRKAKETAAARKAARRTVRELLDVYLAKQKRLRRPSVVLLDAFYSEPSAETLTSKGVSRVQLKPVLAMLGKPVADIDDRAAQALIRKYEARGLSLAQHALTHMRAAYNVVLKDATERAAFGIERNPFAGLAVSERADTTAEEDESGRSVRALSESEVQRLWRGLHETTIVTGGQGAQMEVKAEDRTRLALLLGLACGQRVEQTLMTRAQDIDFDAKTWSIPVAHRKIRRKLRKSSRPQDKLPHVVPLHPLALDLWRQVFAARTSTVNPWLFPATDRDGKELLEARDHRSLSRFVSRWCERHEVAPFTPRDLRRTWHTLGGKWRLDYEVRERIQDHAMKGIGALHYDFHDYQEAMSELMDAYGAKLAALVTPDASGNVVTLADARKAA